MLLVVTEIKGDQIVLGPARVDIIGLELQKDERKYQIIDKSRQILVNGWLSSSGMLRSGR